MKKTLLVIMLAMSALFLTGCISTTEVTGNTVSVKLLNTTIVTDSSIADVPVFSLESLKNAERVELVGSVWIENAADQSLACEVAAEHIRISSTSIDESAVEDSSMIIVIPYSGLEANTYYRLHLGDLQVKLVRSSASSSDEIASIGSTGGDTVGFTTPAVLAAPVPSPAATAVPEAPQTGDDASVELWTVLAVLSLGCMAVVMGRRKQA